MTKHYFSSIVCYIVTPCFIYLFYLLPSSFDFFCLLSPPNIHQSLTHILVLLFSLHNHIGIVIREVPVRTSQHHVTPRRLFCPLTLRETPPSGMSVSFPLRMLSPETISFIFYKSLFPESLELLWSGLVMLQVSC